MSTPLGRRALAIAAVVAYLLAALSATAQATTNPVFNCKDDLATLCIDPYQGENDVTSFPSPDEVWSCMTTNSNSIQNAACKQYIQAMITCQKDAEQILGCLQPAVTEIVSLRRCLRDADPIAISEVCRKSHFYRNTHNLHD